MRLNEAVAHTNNEEAIILSGIDAARVGRDPAVADAIGEGYGAESRVRGADRRG